MQFESNNWQVCFNNLHHQYTFSLDQVSYSLWHSHILWVNHLMIKHPSLNQSLHVLLIELHTLAKLFSCILPYRVTDSGNLSLCPVELQTLESSPFLVELQTLEIIHPCLIELQTLASILSFPCRVTDSKNRSSMPCRVTDSGILSLPCRVTNYGKHHCT